MKFVKALKLSLTAATLIAGVIVGNPVGAAKASTSTTYSLIMARGELLPEEAAGIVAPESAEADGTMVAVVDSGANVNHPWIAGHVIASADLTGKMENPWGAAAGDAVEEENRDPWYDGNGHGTHVAGIVRLHYPNVRLLVAKAINDYGSADSTWIARSIDWAVSSGAEVINLSLGGVEDAASLRRAVAEAVAAGVIVVAAAGNSGHDGSPVFYPAAYPGVVTVAALDKNTDLAYYSNRGSHIDIATDGTQIVSASRKGGLIRLSGTSMAAPKVAATMAKIRKLRPDWTAEQVINHVLASSDDAGPVGPDGAYGYGILNVGKSLDVSEMRTVGGTITAPKALYEVVREGNFLNIRNPDGTIKKLVAYTKYMGVELNITNLNYQLGCFCFGEDQTQWRLQVKPDRDIYLRGADVWGVLYEPVLIYKANKSVSGSKRK